MLPIKRSKGTLNMTGILWPSCCNWGVSSSTHSHMFWCTMCPIYIKREREIVICVLSIYYLVSHSLLICFRGYLKMTFITASCFCFFLSKRAILYYQKQKITFDIRWARLVRLQPWPPAVEFLSGLSVVIYSIFLTSLKHANMNRFDNKLGDGIRDTPHRGCHDLYKLFDL